MAKMKGGRKKGGGGGSAKNELKELRKELREREARAVKEILTGTDYMNSLESQRINQP